MIYQLPTGKIVYLSLEEYLKLTDEDVQYLISIGSGDSPNNPFHGSNLTDKSSTGKEAVVVDADTIHDESMDYNKDTEDIIVDTPIDFDNLPDPDTV